MWDRYICVKAGVLWIVWRTAPELYPVAVRFYCQGSSVGLCSRYVVQRCRERVEVAEIALKAAEEKGLTFREVLYLPEMIDARIKKEIGKREEPFKRTTQQ